MTSVVLRIGVGPDRMVVAAHEMQFADQVVFMAEGTIVEQGTPEEVLVSPRQPRTQDFLRRIL